MLWWPLGFCCCHADTPSAANVILGPAAGGAMATSRDTARFLAVSGGATGTATRCAAGLSALTGGGTASPSRDSACVLGLESVLAAGICRR